MLNEPRNKSYLQIDLQGLVRLLAKNLYADEMVFVRELVQNAHDSLQRRRHGGRAPAEPAIHVDVDPERHVIAIRDNGCGLTEREIEEHLSTIGKSGTAEFRRTLIEEGRADVALIGQFGIGLLSAFMVADEVIIETRSMVADSGPLRWRSQGDAEYSIEPGERGEVGTTVLLPQMQPDLP